MANPEPQPPESKAPRSEPKAVLINGMLVPDADSVRSMLYTLSEKMKKDPELARQFQADARRVLGAIGLNAELQAEVMTSQGIEIPEGGQISACNATCTLTREA